MSEIYNKIELLCKSRGIDITQMCRDLQIPRSPFSELKAGRTKSLASDRLLLVANYFNVTTDFLLGNKNIPKEIILSNQEISLIENYRELTTEGKHKVNEYIEDLLGVKRIYRAAKSSDNHSDEITVLSKEEQERMKKSKRMTPDNNSDL